VDGWESPAPKFCRQCRILSISAGLGPRLAPLAPVTEATRKKKKHPLLPASFSAPVEGLDDLVELALNLRWSWSHHEDELWGPLNPELWELTHNPWVVLQTLSVTRLKTLARDKEFRKQVEYLVNTNKQYVELPTWFQNQHAISPISCVAYFCMEFMLSEALPIYSGGLGNVAGDLLKAASDLGVPQWHPDPLINKGIFGR
jgi:starch phosphorylase